MNIYAILKNGKQKEKKKPKEINKYDSKSHKNRKKIKIALYLYECLSFKVNCFV